MKNKFICLLLFIFALPVCYLLNNNTYNFYNIFNNLDSCIFCYIYNLDSNNNLLQNNLIFNSNNGFIKSLKNGSKQLVYFNDINCLQSSNTPEYMQVEAFITHKEVENIINNLGAKIVLQESYENTKIIYCYTSIWRNFKVLNNKKINLQIAINESEALNNYNKNNLEINVNDVKNSDNKNDNIKLNESCMVNVSSNSCFKVTIGYPMIYGSF